MAKAKVSIIADVDAYFAENEQDLKGIITDYFMMANESVNESHITPINISISDFKENEE